MLFKCIDTISDSINLGFFFVKGINGIIFDSNLLKPHSEIPKEWKKARMNKYTCNYNDRS